MHYFKGASFNLSIKRIFLLLFSCITWELRLRLLMTALTSTGFLDLFKGCACTLWIFAWLLFLFLKSHIIVVEIWNTFRSKLQRVGTLRAFLSRAILALLPSLRFMNTYALSRIFVLTCRTSLRMSFFRLEFESFFLTTCKNFINI